MPKRVVVEIELFNGNFCREKDFLAKRCGQPWHVMQIEVRNAIVVESAAPGEDFSAGFKVPSVLSYGF